MKEYLESCFYNRTNSSNLHSSSSLLSLYSLHNSAFWSSPTLSHFLLNSMQPCPSFLGNLLSLSNVTRLPVVKFCRLEYVHQVTLLNSSPWKLSLPLASVGLSSAFFFLFFCPPFQYGCFLRLLSLFCIPHILQAFNLQYFWWLTGEYQNGLHRLWYQDCQNSNPTSMSYPNCDLG